MLVPIKTNSTIVTLHCLRPSQASRRHTLLCNTGQIIRKIQAFPKLQYRYRPSFEWRGKNSPQLVFLSSIPSLTFALSSTLQLHQRTDGGPFWKPVFLSPGTKLQCNGLIEYVYVSSPFGQPLVCKQQNIDAAAAWALAFCILFISASDSDLMSMSWKTVAVKLHICWFTFKPGAIDFIQRLLHSYWLHTTVTFCDTDIMCTPENSACNLRN